MSGRLPSLSLWGLLSVSLLTGCFPIVPEGGGVANEAPPATPLPARDDSYSYAGPSRDQVDTHRFPPVRFGFNGLEVPVDERSKIASVAEFAVQYDFRVLVAGFTDAAGPAEYNRILGERRALSVREWLLHYGVPVARIQTVSFGEDLPAVPGNSPLNRRVEFGLVP
ncbi:MAG: OmpA family protein [Verrucomicrobiota bacterium]